MAGKIFFSYRRGDDPGNTGLLYERLEHEFHPDQLFKDVEADIKGGDDFVDVLKAQVAECDVLLAVIGPRWIETRDVVGRRLLDDPEDWVRVEIVSAMETRKYVIPILVGGADVPQAEDLPEPLKPLTRRQAIRITEERFKLDAEDLVRQITSALGELEQARTAATEAERNIEVKFRIGSDGREITVELDEAMRPPEIIAELVLADVIPPDGPEHGRQWNWRLAVKGGEFLDDDDKSLRDSGVTSGSVIHVVPPMSAGGGGEPLWKELLDMRLRFIAEPSSRQTTPPPVDRVSHTAPIHHAPARYPARSSRRWLLWPTIALVGSAGYLAYRYSADLFALFGKIVGMLKLGTMAPVPSVLNGQQADVVDCSVFAPPVIPPGKTFFVQVFLHAPAQFERAEMIATRIDKSVQLRSIVTLQKQIERGQTLQLGLSCDDLQIYQREHQITWWGEPQALSFRVTMPADALGQELFPTLRLHVGGVPVGYLEFSLVCASTTGADPITPLGQTSMAYEYAFLSYSSADRKEVTKFARALKAARIDFFQDYLSLRSGEQWRVALFREIDKCDVFFLFWSECSSQSEIVMEELHHAHNRRSLTPTCPEITPIKLDATPPPKVPSWLAEIHFDDHFRTMIDNLPERGA